MTQTALFMFDAPSTKWSGAKDAGSRVPKPDQRIRVFEMIKALPPEGIRFLTLSERANVEGRTLRAILSAGDGVEFLLAYEGSGEHLTIRLAQYQEDAEVTTEWLLRPIDARVQRGDRRRAMTALLPRRQPRLTDVSPGATLESSDQENA